MKHFNNLYYRLIFFVLFVLTQLRTINSQCIPNIQVEPTIIHPCKNDGQISLKITGGTPPYSYKWSKYGSNTLFPNTKDQLNLVPGSYFVTVTDASGYCGSYSDMRVLSPIELDFKATPSHCPNLDGTVEVKITKGGTTPYSFQWSNGGTTQMMNNLPSGIYDVTVTDANGCFTESINLLMPKDITIYNFVWDSNNIKDSIYATPSSCQLNTGILEGFSKGGVPPYTYEWFQQNINNIPFGVGNKITQVPGNNSYYLKTIDANGCINVAAYVKLKHITSLEVKTASTQVNCLNQDGTASVVVNNGQPPYAYLWSNSQTSQQITSLEYGSYKVTVTDNSGCQTVSSVYLSNYSPIKINSTINPEVCSAGNGSITLAPSLGSPPYHYIWNDGIVTGTRLNLKSGAYNVVVYDSKGCSASQYNYIPNQASFETVATVLPSYCNKNNGAINLTINGGIQPFTFLWNNGATSQQISGLKAGYYFYTITDATGCILTGNQTVPEDNQINAYFSINHEHCALKDGSIQIKATSLSLPLQYQWNTGATSDKLQNVSEGTYTVTVTNALGCSVVKSGNVSKYYNPFGVQIIPTPASCIFEADGKAEVFSSGGIPPYTYQWNNGSTTSMASGLEAYMGIGVVVTDGNGCITYTFLPSVGYSSLDCAAKLEGTVYNDVNSNCINEIGDTGLENVPISCSFNSQSIQFTDAFGNYHFYVPKNKSYLLNQHEEYKNQICPTTSIITPTTIAGQNYANNDFYDTPLNVNDLRVSCSIMQSPRPGYIHNVFVSVINEGLYKTSGQVILTYDDKVNYKSGGDIVDQVNRKITINFSNIKAFNGSYSTNIFFETPASVNLGELIKYTAHVYPDLNDATPPNNEETVIAEVVGSFDPNDKSVTSLDGSNVDCILTKDSILKYTIRFQNTGTYPAYYVTIRDLLSPNLDWSTLKGGASSHPYRIHFLPDQSLAFIFDGIYLPDTMRDEKASHGFITYYIKPMKNLNDGVQIKNKAKIYFDYNTPVETNTTTSTICINSGTDYIGKIMKAEVSPNPVLDQLNIHWLLSSDQNGTIEIFDQLGRKFHGEKIAFSKGNNNWHTHVSNLAAGAYFVQWRSDSETSTLKFIKQ